MEDLTNKEAEVTEIPKKPKRDWLEPRKKLQHQVKRGQQRK